MKILLIPIVCCITLISYGQYNCLINEAELLITQGKEKEAENKYQKAFSLKEPFGIDIYNSIIVKINLGYFKKARLECEELVIRGCKKSFFNTKKFNKLKKTKEWEIFEINYPKNRKLFLKTIDQDLVNKLQLLVDADQRVYSYIRSNGYEDFLSKTDTITTYTSNVLLKLFEANKGFFNEKQIGINLLDENTISMLPFFSVLIYHDFQRKSNTFKKFLFEEVKKGAFKPNIYSHLVDIKAGENLGDSYFINKSLGKFYYNNNFLYNSKVMNNRADIEDCPLSDIIAKNRLLNCNKNLYYNFYLSQTWHDNLDMDKTTNKFISCD